MNRIYQGRVTQIESMTDTGGFESIDFGKDQSTCPLWRHHLVFQDAVNYYLLALASMARGSVPNADRLMSDLPKRISESWERFPKGDAARAGARSLRDSVAPWLGLDGSASLEQATSAVLNGNTAGESVLSYALALVLHECSGDSGIQQGGRGYLPKLCDAESNPTYPYSKSSQASAEGKDKLAIILHGETTEGALKEIAAEMELSWTGVKVEPDGFFTGREAVERLNAAIDHVGAMVANPSARLNDLLRAFPNAASEIQEMRNLVDSMSDRLKIQKNRKAAKDLTCSAIVFMAFPSPLTAALLKLGIKAPTKTASAKKKGDEIDFAALGDDPVKLARGNRGYVFRAFTALPRWSPINPGKPVWKEFDIAAFKEALKALNQFRLKTEEREQKKRDLEGLISYCIGFPVKGWKPSSSESGEEAELPEPLEPKLLPIGWELEEEMTRNLSESVVGESQILPFGEGHIPLREGGWTVTRASLRGFREILPEWRRLIAKHGIEMPASQLAEAVKEYQRREGKADSIGSVGLFLVLCEPKFRSLWLDAGNEEEGEENRFLQGLADLHDDVEDYLRCEEAINLTPAEPRYSRRLFMFSDLVGRSAAKYAGLDCVEVSVASIGDVVKEQRIRLRFSAPRLRRDGLLGGDNGWLQPVTKALGLSLEKDDPTPFDSAVSLMPDFDDSGSLRYLLNFAVGIDAEPIRQALGKDATWARQFNGVKDKRIHLHWPGTTDLEKMKADPWWQNSAILNKGFTVLSTDLGQRTAGAWALLRVTAHRPDTKRPVRSIGKVGDREWFGEVIKTGMFRLPGEDSAVRGKDGQMVPELSGKTGRLASEAEWKTAIELARDLYAEEPENWIGADPLQKSYPEQNDSLLALANRRLSRLGTFHRWSCFDPEKEGDPVRKNALLEKLSVELDQWQDEEVRGWAVKLASGDVASFTESAQAAFTNYRARLLPLLLRLADRVTPLREHRWGWRQRGDGTPYGELVRLPREAGPKPPVRGQRGLSMARIEQMENLRRLFLRYNRALDREAGVPAAFGRADAGRASGEPCREILEKIDRIKEQRVNQTAHLILAQALGVKLAPHSLDEESRKVGDHHGEYIRIPDREPVDLVVLEDLSRYVSSQGRAPSENSRLMKWAHRAIRDKVKMLLEEPFGIPILEVPAAYSSRFSAVNGEPGSRCEEKAELDHFLKEMLSRRSMTPPSSGQPDLRNESRRLLEQFDVLEAINARRRSSGKNAPITLLLPKPGGPLFLGAKESLPVQSDINAAINLAFRAVAAPEALHLLHRIRAQSQEGNVATVAKNAREKAAYGKRGVPIVMRGTVSAKLSGSPNFFYDGSRVASFDAGEIALGDRLFPVASGIGLWRGVNEKILPRIIALNEERLRKVAVTRPNSTDPEDHIPM